MNQFYQKSMFVHAFLVLILSSSLLHAETYTVTTTADSGLGSLRDAINTINLSTDATNTINFHILPGGPGYDPVAKTWSIVPQTDLPLIRKQVTIDGYSQPGSSMNMIIQGTDAILNIILNGNNYLTGDGLATGNGLHFAPLTNGAVDKSVVRGLVINQWLCNGILLDTSHGSIDGIKILGNFIGTDANGTREQANRTGIGISRASNTHIGTLNFIDYNVIAGSFSWFLTDNFGLRGACISSLSTNGTSIVFNSIGTDRTGTYALGNSSVGILLRSDQNASIINNVISGHSIYGIRLRGAGNCTIQGNYIGTDVTGTLPVGNANTGIELDDNDSGEGNCIVGNYISANGTGIHIGQKYLPGAINNTVQGNFIGTDVTVTKALPNKRFGIILNDSHNTIGGPERSQANVISGNLEGGILIYGMPNITANIIANNLIGTDITGTHPLPNKGSGIQIGLDGGFGGASGNTIGSSPLLSAVPDCITEPTGLLLSVSSVTQTNREELQHRKRKMKASLNSKIPVSQPAKPVISMPQVKAKMKSFLAQPAQTIGLNFTAATVSNVLSPVIGEAQQSGWVGPQQYILTTYGSIRSFDKVTGQPDGVLDIDASNFFGTVFPEEPRINYSRFLDRWFISCENGASTELLIAWSDSGIITPETIWTISTFTNTELVPQNNSAHGPAIVFQNQLATDANAVYISLSTVDGLTSAYLGTSTLVIPNSSIITGSSSPVFTLFPGLLPTSFTQDIPPADNFDKDAQFGYLINAFAENQLSLFRILNPGSAQATLSEPIALDVPPFATPALAPHKGNLYTQLGDAMFLETSGTFLHAPHVRNKQLYLCHCTQVTSTGAGLSSGDRVGIRWYQFDLTGDPSGNGCGIETESTCPALVQWGTLFDSAAENPKFYYIPALMTNKNGGLVIAGTVSGNNDYTNVFYAGREKTDPLSTLRNPVLITNTTNPFNFGPINPQRWGDFSTLAPDPSNDLIMWSTGEWAALENGWGSQATQLLPAQNC